MKHENKRDRDENTWNCCGCQVVELFWSFITMLKKTKGCKKHIINNEAQKMKILKGTKRKNFDMTWRIKVQLSPKPNNIWNWTWKKCIDGCWVYDLGIFSRFQDTNPKGGLQTTWISSFVLYLVQICCIILWVRSIELDPYLVVFSHPIEYPTNTSLNITWLTYTSPFFGLWSLANVHLEY
jgi:hypothetical protein